MGFDRHHDPLNPQPSILVVDDTESILKLVKVLLESEGYRVLVAPDGVVGMTLFRQNRSQIGLVLTDVVTPGMSGFDLADQILKLDATIPVLFMSRDERLAGHGCLAKPFKSSDLIARVGGALQRPRPQADTPAVAWPAMCIEKAALNFLKW